MQRVVIERCTHQICHTELDPKHAHLGGGEKAEGDSAPGDAESATPGQADNESD